MNKRLIINADDYGLDKPATKAILELADSGSITSTTILANFVDSQELSLLKNAKGISTGWHLNLVEGNPISDVNKVSSLVDNNGSFFTSIKLLKRYLGGKILKADIITEIKNQYAILKDHNLVISHADSHQHTHQLPGIGPIIMKTLKELNITKIRCSKATAVNSGRMKLLWLAQQITSSYTSKFITPEVLITEFSTVKNPDFNMFRSSIDKAFRKYNTVEFMTHPAIDNTKTYLNRKAEFEFLKSPDWKDYLKNKGVKVISYNDL